MVLYPAVFAENVFDSSPSQDLIHSPWMLFVQASQSVHDCFPNRQLLAPFEAASSQSPNGALMRHMLCPRSDPDGEETKRGQRWYTGQPNRLNGIFQPRTLLPETEQRKDERRGMKMERTEEMSDVMFMLFKTRSTPPYLIK